MYVNALFILEKNIWRFLPLGDRFVDMFISRDLDSYILQREIDAVHAWIESGKTAHIMRDNPYHNAVMVRKN